MNKMILLGIAAALGAARLAFFPANPPVELQPVSPGVDQKGHLNISGTATVGLLKSQGTVFGQSTATTGFAYGGFFTAASNQGRGFYGFASATSGLTYGGFFQNASSQGRAVFGLATGTTADNYGGYFQAAGTSARGVLGVATATSGATYGVYGRSLSPDGFGVFSNGNMGASGIISGNGSGLTNLDANQLASGTVSDALIPATVARRNANNTYTGANNFFQGDLVAIGPRTVRRGVNEILALSSSVVDWAGVFITSGSGGKPYYGLSNDLHHGYTYMDADGAILTGIDGTDHLKVSVGGTISAGPSEWYAIWPGRANIYTDQILTNGALYVQNGTPATQFGHRVAIAAQSTGSGTVEGLFATAGSSESGPSRAVHGLAHGNGSNYGVYGDAYGGSTNYAGYFNGLLYADSSTAGVKSFMIDHPLDPANRVLTHSSVESNERKNIYDGVVQTDLNGYATVTMPSWFEALNEEFRYQLTVIDTGDSTEFTLAKVVQELTNGRFKIRTSTPNAKVCWQVTGRRHDPTSNYYPLEVERAKNRDERGKYYVPEAYGRDETYGMAYVPTMVAQPKGQAKPQRKSGSPVKR